MRWTDDDCRAALRGAVAFHHPDPLRIIDYRAWRAAQVTEWPPVGVIVDHLGSWTEAVRHAGGSTALLVGDDCVRALRQAAVDLDLTDLGQDEYRTWADHHDGAPGRQAIVARLGPWPVAMTEADLAPARTHHGPAGRPT